ncbi:MAG TPA: threonine/serine exporter family protein, partial [Candidatus Wallbacteria bacterium]|nr:threonine/serine exporter family protein [Candidatus Wallbacteria bacterium]
MYIEVISAFFGTLFFSIICNGPKKFLFLSGLNGLIAMLVYVIIKQNFASLVFSNFAATSAVVIFSHVISLRKRVPLDVFLVPGIFVLVPGSAIFNTLFSFVSGNDAAAFAALKETLSIGFNISMAIFIFVYLFELINSQQIDMIKQKGEARSMSNNEKIFQTSVRIGEIMLKSGAETHKVEETINTFCSFNGMPRIQSFVIPTGIIATLLYKKFHPLTELVRITGRSLNLGKMTRIREYLNEYYDGLSGFDELNSKLPLINGLVIYTGAETIFASAFAVSFFSVLFNGRPIEFALSFLCGFLSAFVIRGLSVLRFPDQLINLIVSAFMASLSLLIVKASG